MNENKVPGFLILFVLLASCAPILVPQSNLPTGTSESTVTPWPGTTYTATFTATFTPTSYPPGFTPSPVPTSTLLDQRCSQSPPEQYEFELPGPSNLEWETVDGFQSLTGLNGPIISAYPSPDGRWWVIELAGKWNQSEFDYSYQTALYVVDSMGNGQWIASLDEKDYFHRFDWFPDGDLVWVDDGQLYRANADGGGKQALQVPEPVIEIWLDKTTGSRALVGGVSALWHLDLEEGRWDRVEGLESLARNGEPPISRVGANLRMSNDGNFGALLADHEVWKVPMASGEPAHKIGAVEYLDETWRVSAPQPLADSPYWYPGRDAYDPTTFGTPFASMVLIDERDGSLLSLEDIVPLDFGNFLSLQISPDARWVSIYNGERFSSAAIYVAPSGRLTNGRVFRDVGSILDWDITEVRSSYPGRVDHPDIAFVLKGDMLGDTSTIDQIDLVTGETRSVKELQYSGSIPIMQMTWVKNTPIYAENKMIERIGEDGSLQPVVTLPELRSEDRPDLMIGGSVNQILFTAEVNKFTDAGCRVYYFLFIASFDFVT